MRDMDRFRGCLIGGAVGDALGYAVEFVGEGTIFSRYGERGITEYELRDGKAVFSDDTQMTLFTAEGLLEAGARKAAADQPEAWAGCIYDAYLNWLKTQEKPYPLPDAPRSSRLLNVPELFARRAPGNTCLAALRCGMCGSVAEPVNSSKGCGGVMRVAPVGLYFNDRVADVRTVARLGAEAAAITHGHPHGWMPGAVLAQIVHEVSQNDESILNAVLHSLDTVREMWPESTNRHAFTGLIRRAVDLSQGSQGDLEAIHRLGEGWVGDEALAIAVYCALKYPDDFERAIVVSVNHKGDSDSTGAVAGNILGAKLGLSGIPEKYTKNLELRDVILETADEMWKN